MRYKCSRLFPLIILWLSTGALALEMPLTPLVLAKAALAAYDKNPCLEGYQILDIDEDPFRDNLRIDFRATAFINRQEKVLILAYRGSDFNLSGTELVDAGIFFSVTAKKNPYSIISQHLSWFLWNYDKKKWAAKIAEEIVSEYASKFVKESILSEGITEQSYQTVTEWIAQALDLEQVILPLIFSHMGIPFVFKNSFQSFPIADAQNAIEFAKKALGQLNDQENNDYKVYFTGHSLGGFLAQIAGAHLKQQTVTFNAPGAKEFYADNFPQDDYTLKDTSFIVNYYRENDIVGNFGNHIGRRQKIPNFEDSPFLLSRRNELKNIVDQDCTKEQGKQNNEEKIFLESIENRYYPTQLALMLAHDLAYYWENYVTRSIGYTVDPFINKEGVFDVHSWAHQELSVLQYIQKNHAIIDIIEDIKLDANFMKL